MSNIVNLLLVFIIFMSITLLWHQLFRMTSEESMCFSAVFIMVGVFLTGIMGNVKYIYSILNFLSVFGIVCFLFNLSFVKEKNQSFIKRFFTFFNPCVFSVGILFAYAIVAFRGAIFTYPDEIAQWGVAVRYMHETGQLPYGTSYQGEEIILSTTTLFQYIWVGLRKFSERNCLIGNFFLAMIPIFLPFSGTRWKDWKKITIYTVTIFLTMNVISYIKYYTLLQDYVLPLWSGGIIAWLIWSKKDKINWFLLIGSLMCIGMMKSMVGPMFAIIIIIVLCIKQIIVYEPRKISDYINRKIFVQAMILLLSIFSMSLVWSHIIGKNVHIRYSAYYAPEKTIFQIITGMIYKIFYMVSGSIEAFPNMNYFIFGILVLTVLVLLKDHFIDERDRKIFLIVISLYGIGFIFYLLVMLYAYMYVFGASDALSVAGLDRYLSYYMLLGCVPIISLLFMNERLNINKNLKYTSILLLLLLAFGTGGTFVNKVTSFYLPQEVEKSQEDSDNDKKEKSIYQIRMDARTEKNIIENMTGQSGKIFVLGTIKMTDAKILSYELGNRYIWNENSYKIYTRYRSDVIIYQDIFRYPDLFNVYQHEYIWCKGVKDDEEKYLRISYNLNMREIKEGAFYRLVRNKEGLTTEYLGNTEELKEKEK